MIIRVLRAQVRPGKEREFASFLRDRAMPFLRAQAGLLGVHVGLPAEPTPEEFLVVSLWRDLESLTAFAGEEWFEARVLPGERRLLREVSVHHYEDAGGADAGTFEGTTLREAVFRPAFKQESHAMLLAGRAVAPEEIVRSLRVRGIGSLVAPSARSAGRLLEKWRPDVMILGADVAGADALVELAERTDVPLVLVGRERQLGSQGGRRGVLAEVVAPVEAEDVARAAEVIVGGAPRDVGDVVDWGTVRLDVRKRRARIDGREIELPPKEFAVLTELAVRPHQPVSSAELAARVWPERAWVTADDVRRVVYRLRKLIGDRGRKEPLIRNRRGYGYVLELPPEEDA